MWAIGLIAAIAAGLLLRQEYNYAVGFTAFWVIWPLVTIVASLNNQ